MSDNSDPQVRRGRPVAVIARIHQPPTRWQLTRRRAGAALERIGFHRLGQLVANHWSPFDRHGNIRPGLFAVKRVDGQWVPNDEPNDGFHRIGTFS